MKLMRKQRLPDGWLCGPAAEVIAGTIGAGEANLGGGLFKKRVGRPGGGKRGGFRMIIAYHSPASNRVLFTYAFAKNAASTLTPLGQEALQKVAVAFVTADDHAVSALLMSGDVNEVECDDKA